MARLKKGDLVEPTESVVASYSNYGLHPPMNFEPGMLAVVRHVDMAIGGYQIEFFHPATGCMQAARTTLVRRVPWPKGLGLPKDDAQIEEGWRWCGSLSWRGAMVLLQAIAALRKDYFRALTPSTLRIPCMHDSLIRKSPTDLPTVCIDRGAQARHDLDRIVALA